MMLTGSPDFITAGKGTGYRLAKSAAEKQLGGQILDRENSVGHRHGGSRPED